MDNTQLDEMIDIFNTMPSEILIKQLDEKDIIEIYNYMKELRLYRDLCGPLGGIK